MEVTGSFLPAINSTMLVNSGNTGMSAIRTGESFVKSRNNFQLRTGRNSPLKSQSITALLSPREMVKQFGGRLGGAEEEFGVRGYVMPKHESPSKVRTGIIGKNKSPGPIEAEAKYRRQFPGAGAYMMPEDKTWTDRKSPREIHNDMAKSPRKTMADEIENAAKKPEKSTPSPNDYNANKLKFLPNLGKGGSSSLAA